MSSNAVINFVRENIYCFPYQDQQYHFKIVQVNNPLYPVFGKTVVYQVNKQLPTLTDYYHIYTIGHINTNLLNLFDQGKGIVKNKWYNFESDMTDRDIILSVYNDKGIIFPRGFSYYCFTSENSLIFTVKVDNNFTSLFDYSSIKYFRAYSNSYFSSEDYNKVSEKKGIFCKGGFVNNNVDKVAIQIELTNIQVGGGKALVYVNGIYNDNVDLVIPNGSYVEYVYDQSIISKEVIPISGLRSFLSTRDSINKYLLVRNSNLDTIEFFDDTDVYVTTSTFSNNKGLYYYRHNGKSLSMVTDKDYAISVDYVNNQATQLNLLVPNTGTTDKTITIFNRVAGVQRKLVYSNLKLHELYKLTTSKRLDIMLGNNNSIPDLRCETLENSDYFKVTETVNLSDIDNNISVSALGYNAICYYFASNYINISADLYVNIPYLYRDGTTVFEYDNNGLCIGHYTSAGMTYTKKNTGTKHLEFIYGKPVTYLPKYYDKTSIISLLHTEYKVYSSVFINGQQASPWIDITASNKVVRTGNTLAFIDLSDSIKIQLRYADQIVIKDYEFDLTDSTIFIPLRILQDKGNGLVEDLLDIPFSNIDIYLNGSRLTENLDYFLDFPYVNIVNKKYLVYSQATQHVQIRMYGFNNDKTLVNKQNEVGFISHGALSRNNVYDVRQDRVMTFFIDGKLKDKSTIIYAEEDNTVRIDSPINGLPYVISEPYISIKSICNKETDAIRDLSITKNKKFSDFFTVLLPQPKLANNDMIIANRHYIFSPTISKIIEHILNGAIPSTFYNGNYDTQAILTLLKDYEYLYKLDPLSYDIPNGLVEIHPHLGNTTINLNIFQYRLLDNINKIVSKGKVNLSGYVNVTV